MQGRRFFEAMQALPDGGHSAVVVERDGWFWPVEGVEFNSEHFVVLKLGDAPEGAATGRTCTMHEECDGKTAFCNGPVGWKAYAREHPWRRSDEPASSERIPVTDIRPGERVLWAAGWPETLAHRDFVREAAYGGRCTVWRTDAGAALTWGREALVTALLPRPEPS